MKQRYACRIIATAVIVLFALGNITFAGEKAAWAPKFYAFCVEMPKLKDNPPVAEQVKLLRELGFDGVGYPLWLDEKLDQTLKMLDEAKLQPYQLWISVNLAKSPSYDPRVPDAIRKLKDRPSVICVQLVGLKPGDPAGIGPAVKILRELGDIAAEAGVRVSIYNHVKNWTESVPFSLDIVKKANHPAVGANFNLCHWLKVEGDKDYRPLLRENAAKIFTVTINGAQVGAEDWTNGLIQPLDKGDFDNRRLLATLREAGYKGPIGLMCYGIPDDARDHLARSIKVWKQWLAEQAE